MIKWVPEMSIFDHPPFVALVNPVNCVGVMGKGLALEFQRRWPEICATDSEYRKWCARAPGIFAGDLLTVNGNGKRPTIIYFATKNHYYDNSHICAIEDGLQHFVLDQQWDAIAFAFPKLGCGLGGLAWPDVRELMVQYLEPLAVTCYVHGDGPEGCDAK